ncbi:corticotropin-releasing factor-binding protein-like [Gigantopelta aegis]|uniref:corticotropin-releasing factor-binding protein-like n=1 Tax=Gigantopelta aegis TaxID=1735272 RepID=UPI001B88D541|nr:corticotropin-releasing factor-binding protein-like [Gigantopelta aegis]
MESTPGEYYFISDGNPAVCGLYMIGDTDSLVEIEFEEFNIGCESGGLLAVVDGWELQGEFFPNIDDTGESFEERYSTYCGQNKPARIYMADQNVALLQFFVPQEGQGFRVKVRFLRNPQPCNTISMYKEAVATIKNYGQKRNCTMSIIYPENVLLLSVDVGSSIKGRGSEIESGLSVRCENSAGSDHVEFLYGGGLDTELMNRRMFFCGVRSKSARRRVLLGCQNSAVRLVSSGMFYNSITFSFVQPSPDQLARFGNDKC